MILNTVFKSLLSVSRKHSKICKRFFLSEAFQCNEAWNNRLKSPVFRKVDYYRLYDELDQAVSVGQKINVLDLDIFANGMTNDQFQNELEDILFKLRLNPETRIACESMSHAVIRFYLSMNKKEDLLNILSQRLLYGIFPDIYLSILMMDKFLSENDVVSAVKIAVLQMLQEDCNYPILRYLALHSCIKYLNSSIVWETPKEDPPDDNEEVVKVRVPIIRNYYFDDHFDIVNTNHLVGKTMVAFGKAVSGPIGVSSQLIGLILYEKFDRAKLLLEDIMKNDMVIFKDAIDKSREYLNKKPKLLVEDKEKKEETSENEEIVSCKQDIINILNQINEKNILVNSFEAEVESCLKKEIEEHEKNLLEQQCQIYKRWEKEREENIDLELKESKREDVRKEIESMKKELEKEEQKLFYFDHEDEYVMAEEEIKTEMSKVVYYKPKTNEKKTYDEKYIPPDIKRKLYLNKD